MTQGNPVMTKEVAKRLNGAILKLRRRELNLSKKLGNSRVEELRLFVAKKMESHHELAFKQGMSWTDKEVVWLWRVIECARDEQVEAWRESTLSGTPTGNREFAAEQDWKPGRRRGRTLGRVNQQMLELIIAA